MICRICNSNKTKEIVNLGKQPLANKYPKNSQEIKKEKKYILSVFLCTNCKAGQIKNIISRKLMFEEYFYLSSINNKLKNHFKNLAKKLKSAKFVVDIGSNDGVLLEPLKKLNIKSIGIDPSINVGRIANNKGLKTFIGFFDKDIVNKILKKYPKPDVIVASSIITHIEKPKKFIKNLKSFIDKDGLIILEIEYLLNFIKNLEYERFYFDRPFYYSATSIEILFNSVGMTLYDIEIIDTHGGSLRLFIKNNLNVKKTSRCRNILKREQNQLNAKTFKNFRSKIKKSSNKLLNILNNYKKLKKTVIGYGSPARVSTITNFTNINSKHIKYIIDDNPIKQNKFTPGSHIRILPKKNNLNNSIDIVIVFAYEYFLDIKKHFKKFNVKFYKPIPFKILK